MNGFPSVFEVMCVLFGAALATIAIEELIPRAKRDERGPKR